VHSVNAITRPQVDIDEAVGVRKLPSNHALQLVAKGMWVLCISTCGQTPTLSRCAIVGEDLVCDSITVPVGTITRVEMATSASDLPRWQLTGLAHLTTRVDALGGKAVEWINVNEEDMELWASAFASFERIAVSTGSAPVLGRHFRASIAAGQPEQDVSTTPRLDPFSPVGKEEYVAPRKLSLSGSANAAHNAALATMAARGSK